MLYNWVNCATMIKSSFDFLKLKDSAKTARSIQMDLRTLRKICRSKYGSSIQVDVAFSPSIVTLLPAKNLTMCIYSQSVIKT